jgi:hypothetical protein
MKGELGESSGWIEAGWSLTLPLVKRDLHGEILKGCSMIVDEVGKRPFIPNRIVPVQVLEMELGEVPRGDSWKEVDHVVECPVSDPLVQASLLPLIEVDFKGEGLEGSEGKAKGLSVST